MNELTDDELLELDKTCMYLEDRVRLIRKSTEAVNKLEARLMSLSDSKEGNPSCWLPDEFQEGPCKGATKEWRAFVDKVIHEVERERSGWMKRLTDLKEDLQPTIDLFDAKLKVEREECERRHEK